MKHKNCKLIQDLVMECFQERLKSDAAYAKKLRDAESDLISAYKRYDIDVKCELTPNFAADVVILGWQLNIENMSGNEQLVMVSRTPEDAFEQSKFHCVRMHENNA